MVGNVSVTDASINVLDESGNLIPAASNFCKDYIKGCCNRENCRYIHEIPSKLHLKELFVFCHDFQNKGCMRPNCKFLHSTVEEQEHFYSSGKFPRILNTTMPICQAYRHGNCSNRECKFMHVDLTNENLAIRNPPPPIFDRPILRDDASPPEAKLRRYTYEESGINEHVIKATANTCSNCEVLDHRVKLLHDNISVLLKKVTELTEKNIQLTSMNEFLLEQTASIRPDQPCVITSRHGTSAPVSLATVSVTPVVSLAGALPTLMPGAATPNLTLAPAASQAQLLTPAPQILTVSTTQQLMGNSGALIVTSAGAQQLMQVSDSGTLMGGGQTVVAVTPAQLTLAPPTQQLMSNGPQTAVQHLVQSQLPQHQASQFAQQSAQHLAAAQQSAQQLAAAAQQSAQQLAAQQSAQQQLAPSQQLVHQTSTQQITISSTSQPLALTNSQAQPITFPIISQSILPH
ncbi:unnamed protein product [Colias eurytheme]|nr:unnamed protein product [Colias eurytheme]